MAAARAFFGSCFAWLLTAASASAQETCVQLSAELPREVERCVTAQLLCQSYRRGLAANGGDGRQPLVRSWHVRLQVAKATAADSGEARRERGRDPRLSEAGVIALELDALADGRSVGQRTLSVRRGDCAALPDALAWVLVLLAEEGSAASPPAPRAAVVAPAPGAAPPPAAAAQQPSAAEKAQPSAAEPAQSSAAEPAQSSAAERERPSAAEPAPPVRSGGGAFALGAGAGAWFGALPSAAFALQLQVATLGEPLAYRLRATLLWPQQLTVAEGSVLMRDYELALEACPGVQLGQRQRLAVRVCTGPRFGLVYARASDFVFQNDRATEFLLYFGVAPEAALALGPTTWVQLSAGAAVGLVRPRIAVAFGDGQSRTVLPALRWLRAELALSLVQIF